MSKLPEFPGPQLLVCKHHTNRLTSEGCCKVSASWDTGNMFLAHVRVLVVVVIIIKSLLPIISRKMPYQGILSKSSSLFTLALLVSSLIKIFKYFKGKEKRTQPCLPAFVLSRSSSPCSHLVRLCEPDPCCTDEEPEAGELRPQAVPNHLVCSWAQLGLLSLKAGR